VKLLRPNSGPADAVLDWREGPLLLAGLTGGARRPGPLTHGRHSNGILSQTPMTDLLGAVRVLHAGRHVGPGAAAGA